MKRTYEQTNEQTNERTNEQTKINEKYEGIKNSFNKITKKI